MEGQIFCSIYSYWLFGALPVLFQGFFLWAIKNKKTRTNLLHGTIIWFQVILLSS